jgi:hypothetical protein
VLQLPARVGCYPGGSATTLTPALFNVLTDSFCGDIGALIMRFVTDFLWFAVGFLLVLLIAVNAYV